MITVEIKINDEIILCERFVNITEREDYGVYGKDEQLYESVDRDVLVKHRYEDGAKKLAKLILDQSLLLVNKE